MKFVRIVKEIVKIFAGSVKISLGCVWVLSASVRILREVVRIFVGFVKIRIGYWGNFLGSE